MEITPADAPLAPLLSELINRVYAVAEAGLWQDGSARTTPAEVTGLIEAGEILVAHRDGEIVGSVRVRDVGGGVAEFGMLVAHPDARGAGVGRALLDFVETTSTARIMQLELLVPREGTHPSKEFLRGWYTRRGYRLVRTGRLEDDYGHLAPNLAVPCDLEVHHKPLVTDSSP